ncbi:hypothetical protein D3C85_1217400 [compost metagenome]
MLLLDRLEQQGWHPITRPCCAVQADLLEDALPHLALFLRQAATAAWVGPRLVAVIAGQRGLLLLGRGQGRDVAALFKHLQHLHLVGEGGIEGTMDRGGHGVVSNHKGRADKQAHYCFFRHYYVLLHMIKKGARRTPLSWRAVIHPRPLIPSDRAFVIKLHKVICTGFEWPNGAEHKVWLRRCEVMYVHLILGQLITLF